MRLDGRDDGNRLAPLALGLAALVAAALWWGGGDDAPAPTPSAKTQVQPKAAAVAVGPSQPTAAPAPDPTFDALAPTPRAAIPPTTVDHRSTPREPLPVPTTQARKATPPGTSPNNALALRKLPHSVKDRGPVGGVGSKAMHVDRINMGTQYDAGSCVGPVGKFSVRDDDIAHVCFRVVHHRVEQQVQVRWERDGRLVRRAFVHVGASHGYRTRAGLRLRRSYRGSWTVRVISPDGVELASHAFQILD